MIVNGPCLKNDHLILPCALGEAEMTDLVLGRISRLEEDIDRKSCKLVCHVLTSNHIDPGYQDTAGQFRP